MILQPGGSYREVRTARRLYLCDDRGDVIAEGERYHRLVAFPGHVANQGAFPYWLRYCRRCWGRTLLEMTPKRRAASCAGASGSDA